MAQKIKHKKQIDRQSSAVKRSKQNVGQQKPKNLSKPFFHTFFKFIDKYTFPIFCTLILVMITVSGLYMLGNQTQKEDGSVTPMVTNQPLTDSPPPEPGNSNGTVTIGSNFQVAVFTLIIIGSVCLFLSFIFYLTKTPKSNTIYPIAAALVFIVSFALAVSSADQNTTYLIISLVGIVLSMIVACICYKTTNTSSVPSTQPNQSSTVNVVTSSKTTGGTTAQVSSSTTTTEPTFWQKFIELLQKATLFQFVRG